MSLQAPAAATPERRALPPLRLRIGVIGHRPDKLTDAHAAAILPQVTDVIRSIASEAERACRDGCEGVGLGPPELVAISALAAGADQLIARAALAQGWRLETVLPFVRDDYANDMSGTALAEFRALLDASSSVAELDGKRAGAEAENRAYEAAGLVTIANSDIIISIWDRQPAEGRGGTALILDSAIDEGIPIVLIDPAGLQEPKLIWAGFSDLPAGRPRIEELVPHDARSRMREVVDSLILPPPDSKKRASSERQKLRTYLAETEWRVVPHFSYPILQWVFAGRRPRRTDVRHPVYVPATRKEWQPYLDDLPAMGRLSGSISQTLLPSYAFADRIAVVYAQLYRSAFTFNYLAASVAVTIALLGVFKALPGKEYFIALELVLIILISWRVYVAHNAQWHRRWLEYRRLAEELRHLRMLAPVAGATRFPRPPLLEYNQSSWISWQLMINARALPLPNAVIDQTYLRKLSAAVCAHELEGDNGQIAYNTTTTTRMHKIDARLHKLGLFCFLATAAVCVGYLLDSHHLLLPEAIAKEWATFLTALLPTLGAAFNAIRVQGDFESFSTRAKRTLGQLERIAAAIKQQAVPDAKPAITLARLADRIDKAADAMSNDLDEWQLLSTTKPVSQPA